MKKLVIAIDGPAASGKSTTAKLVASQLQYVYIDTGAMYRACALQALRAGIAVDDATALEKMMESVSICLVYRPEGNRILLNNEDVSERIREADITKMSSSISQIAIVRTKMVDLQRRLGKQGGVVMDGRDIGTVVFPDADLKFFMIADVHTRALRRWQESQHKGENLSLEDVENELRWRDKNDSERVLAPLLKAPDAMEIDTTMLSIEEQADIILQAVKQWQACHE